ncbi:MAG: hypothetical protein Q8R70_10405, partial [Methanoregula sp.]|nr:hypothetical protein [Methanoregula sp.]
MFENVVETRLAICGAGLLLALIFLISHLPLILLMVPVAILFLGIVADPEETHAVWYGMLSAIGIFDLSALDAEERATCTEKKHYFWFGEVAAAAVLALVFCIPAGLFLATRTEVTLAFISAALLFLPLFVFLPRIIRQGMKADTGALLETFGKNEQVKKVFWTVFAALAGLVLVRVVDPVVAQQVVGVIAG